MDICALKYQYICETETMRYALIGCGRVSPNHIAAAKNNGLEIAAICDIIPEAMGETVKHFGTNGARQYTDYREMLACEHPDIATIATPSGSHASIAMDCIAAGCNVIIEKPIALSIQDAEAVIKAGKEAGVQVCVCHQNRFNKSIQYIRRALDAGRFGRLMHGTATVRWNRGQDYYAKATWRGTWEEDGGCLMNQCIHSIDLLRWMMGDEVEEVIAYTDRLIHPYMEAEDFGMAMMKFRNGAYGMIEGSVNVYPANLEETLYIFGENGTAKASGISDNTLEIWNFADGLDDPAAVKVAYSETPPTVYGFGHTPLYKDMIDAIRFHRKPYADGEAGLRAMELVLAIYKSAAEHRPVRLPLTDCSTVDFCGRFGD